MDPKQTAPIRSGSTLFVGKVSKKFQQTTFVVIGILRVKTKPYTICSSPQTIKIKLKDQTRALHSPLLLFHSLKAIFYNEWKTYFFQMIS